MARTNAPLNLDTFTHLTDRFGGLVCGRVNLAMYSIDKLDELFGNNKGMALYLDSIKSRVRDLAKEGYCFHQSELTATFEREFSFIEEKIIRNSRIPLYLQRVIAKNFLNHISEGSHNSFIEVVINKEQDAKYRAFLGEFLSSTFYLKTYDSEKIPRYVINHILKDEDFYNDIRPLLLLDESYKGMAKLIKKSSDPSRAAIKIDTIAMYLICAEKLKFKEKSNQESWTRIPQDRGIASAIVYLRAARHYDLNEKDDRQDLAKLINNVLSEMNEFFKG